MVEPMASPDEVAIVDIWGYIESISETDFDGFSMGDNEVQMVRRTGDMKYDHVLIPAETKNVYLVLVVDLAGLFIFGHHILNLNEKYGLETPRNEL